MPPKNDPSPSVFRRPPPVAVRRSLLFMPGDDAHKIEKGITSGADAIIMDIEDGTALNRKQAARDTIREALLTLDFGRTGKLVRLNGVESGMMQDDLRQTIAGRPDAYVLPKVDSSEAIQALSHKLGEEERSRGWPVGGIGILAVVESARGILNLNSIAAADLRLAGLIFGAEDLAGDLGAVRTPEGWEVLYARSAVVIAAVANNLQSFDTVYVALADLDGLRADALRAAQMGFTGKLAIHPRQVAVIHEAFTPSAVEIDRAQRLIIAFEENQRHGAGAFAFEGKMVDLPLLRAAQRVLQRAGLVS
jgi:citrate lyase beta subunit